MSPHGLPSDVTFSAIARVADLPPRKRLLSDTEGVPRNRISAEKLLALNDETRAHVAVAELAVDNALAIFTDIPHPEDATAVAHTLALVRSRYPGREIRCYLVPSGFVAGMYAHSLDSLNYDEADDGIWDTIDAIFCSALERKASDVTFLGSRTTFTVEFLIHGFKVVDRHLSADVGERIARALYRSASTDAQDRNFNPGQPQETSFDRAVAGEVVRYRYQHVQVDGGSFDVCLRVLRLSEATSKIDFTSLGFLPEQVEQLHRVARMPKGLVLTVGPTGSGKSTTNKGFIESYDLHHRGRKNIREVSNPVEYVIENVRSTNVVTHGNSTAAEHHEAFVAALRALVRLNPHAILVGEIRDQQTAALTVELSRTGHKVFSSGHADRWIEFYPRLRNWLDHDPGIYTAGFVAAIVSQELLPTVCPSCAVPLSQRQEPPYIEIRGRLQAIDPRRAAQVLTEGRGCAACSYGVPGVAGRTVVATMYFPSPAVLALLREQRDDEAWAAWAMTDLPLAGFTTHDHALEHIFTGRVDPVSAEMVLGSLRPRAGIRAARLVASS